MPQGKRLVQVRGVPVDNKWAWADQVGSFQIADGNGTLYLPSGAWARIKREGKDDAMIAKYSSDGTVSQIDRDAGTPMEVWMAFLIPSNVDAKELWFKGKLTYAFK